jgi:acetoin utilization protein AcuC
MTDGEPATWRPWVPAADADAVDVAIMATRTAVFPLHGLDPHDPRD